MKKYIVITSILSVLLLASCESYLDVNQDPNNPTTVTPDLILPVAQTYTASIMQQDRGINHLGNMIMYNWSEAYGFSWYDEEFKYLITPTFYDQIFNTSYSNPLKQYAQLDDLAEEYNHYKAISKIMKSFHFQLLVDFYGDIPYSEALQRGEIPTPKYDNAQAIYNDLLVQLDEAISLIKAANDNSVSVTPGDDDVMFGGDMIEWIRFANTLKLRILVRMSDVTDVSSQVAAIEAEGSGYITGDVAVQPGYLVEENKQNPFWDELGADAGGTVTLSNDATCATQFIIDYLTTTNDPRIDFMYEKPSTGHLGVEQGEVQTQDQGADFVSNIGPGHLKSATMDAVIFTHAESYFLQAEAAVEGFGSGDPGALYNMGVQASFNYLGAGDASGYLAQAVNNIGYAASTNKLEAIITQKWLAVNGITAEQSWFDYTRTGYPLNLPLSLQTAQPNRPVRLAYPSSEITGNTVNVPSQPNAFSAKIFWAN